MTQPPTSFRVALTADFYDASGATKYRDIGLSLFDGYDRIVASPFTNHRAEIDPQQLTGVNGVIVLTPRVTAHSLIQSEDLLAVGRFGVGFDSVDVKACTAADVLLYITAGAVDRPVAEATVGWMLALTHHLRMKDRLVREARWDERSQYMGTELRDRTLGVIGFGGIGQGLVRLLSGFGMKQPVVFDPFANSAVISELGVRSVTLDELLEQADFVSLHCPLNEHTRNLIGARQLGLMKPTAYLINTARGGIIDEAALFDALTSRQIAGAALDCFQVEPHTAPPVFSRFDNVLLAPHCIAWTDEMFRDIGRAACQGMIDLASGQRPRGIVNPDVLNRPGFVEKWKRLCNVTG